LIEVVRSRTFVGSIERGGITMPLTLGNITIHMGPKQTGGPDDLQKAIIDFIKGAKRKLDIAVQELDNKEIAKAIIERRQKGVQVRIVKEMDYLRTDKPVADPWSPGGKNEVNREIQAAILRTAIMSRADYNPDIFHQKYIVRDSRAVLTGSTNFTETGVGANLNHVVVVDAKKVANAYTQEFNEISRGRFGRRSVDNDEKPREVMVSAVRVKPLFAPDHSPEMEIMKHIAKARRRIDFAVFTFSKSSGIDDALILQSKTGLPIRGALDRRQANQKWAATRPVKNAGAELYLVGGTDAVRKLHHKLMVIDDQVTIFGSFNYTGPANATNDENILVIGNLDASTAAERAAQRRIARYARNEIDRIIRDHGRKLT
jgi:phosphatidylserine/phosphatidylglycerophosphate/cardiolipin synthase-like enzyme